MGRKLRRSSPENRKQKPFLVKHIKIVNRPPNRKSKKNTANHDQLLDYLFSMVEEQKNISAELYEKIARHDTLINELLNEKKNTETKEKKADPPYKHMIDLLNSLHPCTKVDSIVIKDSVIPVDTFINYNPVNQLVYFLREGNIVVVNATQIHKIAFKNIS